MKNKIRGAQAFDEYYGRIYAQRWNNLKESLRIEKKSVALENPFEKSSSIFLQEQGATLHPQLPLVWCLPDHVSFFKKPSEYESEFVPYYLLDEASVWAAFYLGVKKNEKILDLCAAPGGKSLALLFWCGGELTIDINDISQTRLTRLKKVMNDHLPSNVVNERLNFYCLDGKKWGIQNPNKYDRVLLDAPCSSERHWIMKESYLDDWKEGRTKRLSKEQFTLLCSAFDGLKDEGILIYSTCSISPLENDNQFEKLKIKRPIEFIEINSDNSRFEKTKFGYQIFPDASSGIGPIYFSKIKKASKTEA